MQICSVEKVILFSYITDNLMVDPVYMRTLGNGPKKVNGRFKFEDVIDVQIMGNFRDKRVIHLKRQNIDTSSHHVVGVSLP